MEHLAELGANKLESLADPKQNTEYIKAMKEHFGTNKAKVTYLDNQRKFYENPGKYREMQNNSWK